MDTILTAAIVLAAAAWAVSSVVRRIAGRSEASCSSGCSGCALAQRCGAASANGASPGEGAPLPPHPDGSTVSPRRVGER